MFDGSWLLQASTSVTQVTKYWCKGHIGHAMLAYGKLEAAILGLYLFKGDH